MRYRIVLAAATVSLLMACGGGSPATGPAAAAGGALAATPAPTAQAQLAADTQAAAVRVFMALNGRAPTGAEVAAASTLSTLGYAALLAHDFSSLSDSAFSSAVLTNMGVTSARVNATSLTVLRTALAQFFAAYGSSARGIIVNNLVSLLAALEADGTWGTAARAFNTSVGAANASITAAAVSVPLQSAFRAYVDRQIQQGYTLKSVTVASGQRLIGAGTGTHSQAPSTAVFEGRTAKLKTHTLQGVIAIIGGIPQQATGSYGHYYSTAYLPVGRVSSGNYCVVDTATDFPVTARAGDSGVWFVETCYTSSTKQSVVGTVTFRWQVVANDATSLLLLVSDQKSSTGAAGTATGTNTEIFTVTTAGRLSQAVTAVNVSVAATGVTAEELVTYSAEP